MKLRSEIASHEDEMEPPENKTKIFGEEEREELKELRKKQYTEKYLTRAETERLLELQAQETADKKGGVPLSREEREELMELRRAQITDPMWNEEDAKRLFELTHREAGK